MSSLHDSYVTNGAPAISLVIDSDAALMPFVNNMLLLPCGVRAV